MLPLKQVKYDKGQAQNDRREDPFARPSFVTLARSRYTKDHRQTRRQQAKRHHRREDDTWVKGKRCGPYVRSAEIAIGNQHCRERQRVGNDKEPHPQLAMADVIRQCPSVPVRCRKSFGACFSTHCVTSKMHRHQSVCYPAKAKYYLAVTDLQAE